MLIRSSYQNIHFLSESLIDIVSLLFEGFQNQPRRYLQIPTAGRPNERRSYTMLLGSASAVSTSADNSVAPRTQ